MISEERYVGLSIIFVAIAAAVILTDRITYDFFGAIDVSTYILLVLLTGFTTVVLFERVFPTQGAVKKWRRPVRTEAKIKTEGLVLFFSILVIETIIVGFVFYQGYINEPGRLSEMIYLTVLFLALAHGLIAYLSPETFLPIWRIFMAEEHSGISDKQMMQYIKDEGVAMIVISVILTLGSHIGLKP
ncbi:MAG: hypothetical protein KKD39_00435 [Candidatus Altiarchaeota archaeon]|nr:hypothetical protein [Candidatus Altiarchaeota archaeon]